MFRRTIGALLVAASTLFSLQQTVSAAVPTSQQSWSAFSEWFNGPEVQGAIDRLEAQAARAIDPNVVVRKMRLSDEDLAREWFAKVRLDADLSALGSVGNRIRDFIGSSEFIRVHEAARAAFASPEVELDFDDATKARLASLVALGEDEGFWSSLGTILAVAGAVIVAIGAVAACVGSVTVACVIIAAGSVAAAAGAVITLLANDTSHSYIIREAVCENASDCHFRAEAFADSSHRAWDGQFCYKDIPGSPFPGQCRYDTVRYTTLVNSFPPYRVYEAFGLSGFEPILGPECKPFVEMFTWFQWTDGYTTYDHIEVAKPVLIVNC